MSTSSTNMIFNIDTVEPIHIPNTKCLCQDRLSLLEKNNTENPKLNRDSFPLIIWFF